MRYSASKGTSLWRWRICISFAISMESLPPEMHTAILSPGLISSYSRTAFIKGRQMGLRNAFNKLLSARWAKVMFSRFISSTSPALHRISV